MSKREFLKILMGLGTDKRFKDLFTKHELDLLKGILKDIDNMSENNIFCGVVKGKNEELKNLNDNLQEQIKIYKQSLNVIDRLTNIIEES